MYSSWPIQVEQQGGLAFFKSKTLLNKLKLNNIKAREKAQL